MSWDNILIANVGWDTSYRGEGVSSHHGYVVEHGAGAEDFNFKPVEGLFYGYVRGGSALGRFSDKLWTIIFISKPTEQALLRVVGWYESASIGSYRDRPEYAANPEFPWVTDNERYVFSAISKSAFVVPFEARASLILPKGHRIKSGGIYYAAGGDTTGDTAPQAASREQMASWVRSALPQVRSISRVERQPDATVPQIPGIAIDDGGQPHGYSPVGESEEHRSLRKWVCAHPEFITGDSNVPKGQTETVLASADRVDATFVHGQKYWAVEVKSSRSNDDDHFRGIYQCVKYRAVAQAMDTIAATSVEAILVTEKPLLSSHAALAQKLDVRHMIAPKDRP